MMERNGGRVRIWKSDALKRVPKLDSLTNGFNHSAGAKLITYHQYLSLGPFGFKTLESRSQKKKASEACQGAAAADQPTGQSQQ